MKYAFLTVALMAAGAASAFSVDWSAKSITGNTTQEVGSHYASTTFALSTTITLNSNYKGAVDLFGLADGQNFSGNTAYVRGTNSANGYRANLAGASQGQSGKQDWTTPAVALQPGNTYHVSLVVQRNGAENGGDLLRLYIGGTLAGTLTLETNMDAPVKCAIFKTDAGATYSDTYVYTKGAEESLEDFMDVAIGYSETGLMPEPTALALLALGVAGLALRRRAA